jgi:transposase
MGLSDREWAETAPLLPPAKPGGNRRSVDLRRVFNRLMYILGIGCHWRANPDFGGGAIGLLPYSVAGLRLGLIIYGFSRFFSAN